VRLGKACVLNANAWWGAPKGDDDDDDDDDGERECVRRLWRRLRKSREGEAG
jgi:hypothetical protein